MSNLNWRNVQFIVQWIILYDHLIVISAEDSLKEDCFGGLNSSFVSIVYTIHGMSSSQ
jgi:hypothetical protein